MEFQSIATAMGKVETVALTKHNPFQSLDEYHDSYIVDSPMRESSTSRLRRNGLGFKLVSMASVLCHLLLLPGVNAFSTPFLATSPSRPLGIRVPFASSTAKTVSELDTPSLLRDGIVVNPYSSSRKPLMIFSTMPAATTEYFDLSNHTRESNGLRSSFPPSISSPGVAATLSLTPVSKVMSSNPVKVLFDLVEMASMIHNAEQDQLIVLSFHAIYCKVCQRTQLKYRKIALGETKEQGCCDKIQFASLESSKLSSDALRSLGVSKFPFMQIWRNGQCVSCFGAAPIHSFQRRLKDTLDVCKQRSPQEWSDFAECFAKEIRSSQEALDQIRVKSTEQ